jgi:hypothetical protein
MPINDPVRRGKVAPASLAFERRREGATYVSDTGNTGNVTYQTFVTNQYRFGSNITVNVRAAEETTRATMAAMANAERRAKHHASDWHYAFEWDSGTDTLFDWSADANPNGATNVLTLPNEVVRSISAENVSNQWSFYATADNAGTWLLSAFVGLRIGTSGGVSEARLAVIVNDTVYRYIDMMNAHYTDKSHLDEIILQGTALVPLATGDRVRVAIMLRRNSGSSSGQATESQYYAYVNGARVRCSSETENAAIRGNIFDNTI